jgi:hypothetical protein
MDTPRHNDDRVLPRGYFVWRDSLTGEFCSETYAKRNPATTTREWVDVPEGENPDIAAIVSALKFAATAPEHDVAEYIMDANVLIQRYYMNIMSAKER